MYDYFNVIEIITKHIIRFDSLKFKIRDLITLIFILLFNNSFSNFNQCFQY